ncbi:hypothetical protein SAMN04487995_4205 [Dyadobacter koreensis]|uniref:Uncharacterized protein n=1 Tax=Dyadobacter koreensis TaxID=408657 RepID=A0A1H6Y5J2_9BACT|nr:hypothetical protein [Dyadobacter koreensis]SEJ32452.1 hypothetical protein SAMN04487995_4205 [Dyadobacter koreensis]
MAKGNHLSGLDMTTRRKASSRAFEDMKAGKGETAKTNNPVTQEKKLERVGTGSREKKVTAEEPYFKARLTVRERKTSRVKTGVSIADE